MRQRLHWLTLGAFAIGTPGLVIAGLLPSLAADPSASIAMTGQLVTAFSIACAIASPSLAIALLPSVVAPGRPARVHVEEAACKA